MADVSVLEVFLHDRPIGTLTLLQGDRSIFAFNQDYIDEPSRPTLSLSFKDDLGELITECPATRTKVLPFFSNLLPEGPLRDYLAERARVKPSREFYLLWALGRDLPGAVTIRPAEGEAWPPADDDDGKPGEGGRRNALRFSLAGVQLKFSALKNEGKHGGLTIPADGVGGAWIVKLPSEQFVGVPENEFSMMTLARRIGIDVPDVRLVELDAIEGLPEGVERLQGKAYAVRRFDRTEDGPKHIEDFAQVFGRYPDDKYAKASYRNIARVIGIETDEKSIAEFIRRLVFCTLIGNDDMHLKNWSLIYPDQRTAALAPAYDLVSTIPYLPNNKDAALKYARTKRMDELTYDELSYLAAKAALPERLVLDAARETVEAFWGAWEQDKRNLELPTQVIEDIDRHLATLPIARSRA
jgi:serine/threonine-protein kinase HipA